jgi:hypothetical protein
LNKREKSLGGLNENCFPKLEADDLCKEKKMVPLRKAVYKQNGNYNANSEMKWLE